MAHLVELFGNSGRTLSSAVSRVFSGCTKGETASVPTGRCLRVGVPLSGARPLRRRVPVGHVSRKRKASTLTKPMPMGAKPGGRSRRKGCKIKTGGGSGPRLANSWPRCHEEFSPSCAQCRFDYAGHRWVSTYGNHRHRAQGRNAACIWLQVAPYVTGKKWSIGCAVCAELQWRLGQLPLGRKTGAARCWSTKWARFEIRALSQMQACAFLHHSQSEVHKTAMKAHLCPTRPVDTWLDESAESGALFRGAVPQVQHWLLAWRCLRNPTSWSASAAIQGTAAFVARLRTGQVEEGASRKALRSMTRILSEVRREEKRTWLANAHSVCISLDDRGEYRIIRFRCDAKDDSAAACPRWEAKEGILATLRKNGNSREVELKDLDNDYGNEMKESIVRGLRRLATPMNGQCDEQLVATVLAKIHTFCADGASSVQKCGALLKAGPCPGITLILRDPAHAVRTSLQEPVKGHESFADFWESIFDSRHALVPDIMNSEKWRSRLFLAQKHVLIKKGAQGGGLASALQHLSFAKQRFDSAAAPARKYVCMLSAIAIVLVTMASDTRVLSATRKRAQKLLDQMTPKQIMTAGLFADYTAETIRFVRHFDTKTHDIALTHSEKLLFLNRLRVLFVECHVLAEQSPGVPGETCAHIAISQAMSLGTVYYMDRALNLWPQGAKAEAMEAVASMQDIVAIASDRLEAELPRTGLVIAFACFDITIWRRAASDHRRGNVAEAEAAVSAQRSRALRLARAFPGIHQPCDTADDLCRTARDIGRTQGAQVIDNRLLWGEVVARGTLPPDLARMVYWYLSIADITGPVERDLGSLTAVWSQHVGTLDSDGQGLADALEVFLEGPACETALAQPRECKGASFGGMPPEGSGGVPPGEVVGVGPTDASDTTRGSHKREGLLAMLLAPEELPDLQFKVTRYTERCAELWLLHHGRRFNVYRKRAGQQRTVAATDRAVARGQAKALDALFAEGTSQLAGGQAGETTILRVRRSRLVALREQRPRVLGHHMTRFVELTKKKHQRNTTQRNLRQAGRNPYPAPRLKLGSLFTGCTGAAAVPPRARQGRIACLFLAAGEPPNPGAQYRVYRWSDVAKSPTKLLDEVRVVVMDNTKDFGSVCSCPGLRDSVYAQIMLAIVARGKTITSKADFVGKREGLRHNVSQEVVPASIELSQAFVEKHPQTARIFRACSRAGGSGSSKWEVKTLSGNATSDSSGVAYIASMEDVVRFVRRIRRVSQTGCAVRGDIFA